MIQRLPLDAITSRLKILGLIVLWTHAACFVHYPSMFRVEHSNKLRPSSIKMSVTRVELSVDGPTSRLCLYGSPCEVRWMRGQLRVVFSRHFLCNVSLHTMSTRFLTLSNGWYWKERNPSRGSVLDEVPRLPAALITSAIWSPARKFPSEIYAELLIGCRIPDPFVGFNEHEVQWVGENEWLYYCSFDFQDDGQDIKTELIFEGLDTICDVYLNYQKILSADNMFRTYAISVHTPSLHPRNNKLLLHFKSAKAIAKQLEVQYGRIRAGSTNLGDPSRVYVRKAQYGWRWDWGPELMTCGPYRPITLVVYKARISSAYARAVVSANPAHNASLNVDVTISGVIRIIKLVRVILKDLSGQVLKEETIKPFVAGSQESSLHLKDVVKWDVSELVQLWWPVGYGQQYLYDAEIILIDENSTVADRQTRRIGFRRVELVQESLLEADQYGTGTTFLFEVNGVRMFMGGSNWIPAHNLLTELTPEKYRAWLTLLRDGNQNMVRLWGGGIYEPDVFYDNCDELGILVWQDFQFACGVYPAHDDFVANVQAEAEDNVKRLRHHPSLALLCGNNEDYQQVLQWGGITDLPARLIYESVLPSVVSKLTDPPVPYHRGSPYGGVGWDTTDPTVGDIHQWDVWAGRERPWQEYSSMGGRFISEFGIPAMPDIRTVDYWLDGNVKERWAQSRLMSQHNRAGNHERRFAVVINENFRLTSDLETHIFNTQLMQSEAVGLAYRMWRREWRGRGKEYTAGALVWQLNDCWPVTSWSIADFFLRPKAAYYTIARALALVSLGIYRTVIKNRDNDRPKQFYEFGAFRAIDVHVDVWAANSTLKTVNAKLLLHCVDIASDWSHSQTIDVVLQPNQSTELLSIPCPCPHSIPSKGPSVTTSASIVVGARLVDSATGEILARYADWPQPYRHVDVPEPGLQVIRDGEQICVDVSRPVKCLVFSAHSDNDDGDAEVKFSDNALDVMPGDSQTVLARGIGHKKLRVAYLGSEKASVV